MIGDILQPTHLLFILVVALLVLGPKRLPEAGRALGKGLRDFRTAMSGDDDHHTEIPTETPAPPGEYVPPPAAHQPPATYAGPAAAPVQPPPADAAIQAAVYAATPAEDVTAEPVEHAAGPAHPVDDAATRPAESAHPVG